VLCAQLHESEIRRAIGVAGRGDFTVDGVATFDAMENNCLHFLDGELTPDFRSQLSTLHGYIVVARIGSGLAASLVNGRLLEVERPRVALASVLRFIRDMGRQPPWIGARAISASATISPLAYVAGDVEIGDGVVIEPFCSVGPDVAIGRGTILRAGSRVCPRVRIGEDSVIGANSVIGSEGYGFIRDDAGNKLRIPHLGGTLIGSHVEIGAIAVVQYGTISPTIIEDHVKIDDNVEVGHNVRIRRGASVTGGVVIGGSAVIEAEAWIGINSSVRNGRRVGERALVGMDVSVQHDLADHQVARAPRPQVRPRNDDNHDSIGFSPRQNNKA